MKHKLKKGCKGCGSHKADFKVLEIDKQNVIIEYECRHCLDSFGVLKYYS